MTQENDSQQETAPPVISYLSPEGRTSPPTGFQVMVGVLSFFAWLFIVVVVVIGINSVKLLATDLSYSFIFVGAAIVGLLILGFYMQHRGWKSFIPGVFIGLGLSILIGCGICAAVLQHG